jgi:hypothetical protein
MCLCNDNVTLRPTTSHTSSGFPEGETHSHAPHVRTLSTVTHFSYLLPCQIPWSIPNALDIVQPLQNPVFHAYPRTPVAPQRRCLKDDVPAPCFSMKWKRGEGGGGGWNGWEAVWKGKSLCGGSRGIATGEAIGEVDEWYTLGGGGVG